MWCLSIRLTQYRQLTLLWCAVQIAHLDVVFVHVTEPAGVQIEDSDAAAHSDEVLGAVQRGQVHQHRAEPLLDLEPHRATVKHGAQPPSEPGATKSHRRTRDVFQGHVGITFTLKNRL